jgi:HlyD family secretion protein
VKKSVIMLVLAGIAAVAAGTYLVRGRPEKAAAAPAFALAEVARRDIDVVAEASGVVEPIRVVEVKSKASGEALEVAVETGDRVEAGTLLARIDPRDVQSAYDQAVADEEAARVHVRLAQTEQARIRKIRESGLASPQDLEAAEQTTADARAALVRADTNLRLARERLADVTIKAPAAGTMLSRSVEPGQIIASATQNVSGGTTLFTMADLTTMQARAKVDEVDIGQVRAGQRVRVSVDAYPGRSFEGEVAKIEPLAVIEQNVTLFPVLVRLGNPEDLLRPGMNADVSIEIATREDVVAVPNAAAVSVRDARTAAATLGIEELDLRAANADTARSDRRDGHADGKGTGTGDCAAVVQKLRSGGRESLSDAERATLQACRDEVEARQDAAPVASSAARPAVVFVESATGPRPRLVRLGLSDWDYSEVIDGLAPGDRVVMISVAQMQKQQQEATERIRQRMAGPMGTATSSPARPRGGN